jgi:uncharacterized membrane protein
MSDSLVMFYQTVNVIYAYLNIIHLQPQSTVNTFDIHRESIHNPHDQEVLYNNKNVYD